MLDLRGAQWKGELGEMSGVSGTSGPFLRMAGGRFQVQVSCEYVTSSEAGEAGGEEPRGLNLTCSPSQLRGLGQAARKGNGGVRMRCTPGC